MPRKKSYQYQENDLTEDFVISRSQKKRDSTALQDIGTELTKLPNSKLAKLPLGEDLKTAIADYQKNKNREAKRRLLQYIGRLMREDQEEALMNNSKSIVDVYLELKETW